MANFYAQYSSIKPYLQVDLPECASAQQGTGGAGPQQKSTTERTGGANAWEEEAAPAGRRRKAAAAAQGEPLGRPAAPAALGLFFAARQPAGPCACWVKLQQGSTTRARRLALGALCAVLLMAFLAIRFSRRRAPSCYPANLLVLSCSSSPSSALRAGARRSATGRSTSPRRTAPTSTACGSASSAPAAAPPAPPTGARRGAAVLFFFLPAGGASNQSSSS